MAFRVYLVPKAVSAGPMPATGPKYIQDVSGVNWAAIDYGVENVMLVGADVTPEQHTDIAANADVTAIPANLESNVGGALSTVQNALEDLNLPGSWVTAGMTWRSVVGKTGDVMLFNQRFNGLYGVSMWQPGMTLNTKVSDLPAVWRERLGTCAESFGLDVSFATGNTTMREFLRTLSDAMEPIVLMGEVF